MRPDPGRVLQGTAISLLTGTMPAVPTPFGQQEVGLSAAMNMMLAEEIERGADRLVVENEIVRGILADGARYTSGAERAQVDAALARPAPVNLRISTLQAENDALRAALILVHAAVDGARDAEAKALDERIWAELVESTKRRQFASRLG